MSLHARYIHRWARELFGVFLGYRIGANWKIFKQRNLFAEEQGTMFIPSFTDQLLFSKWKGKGVIILESIPLENNKS